MTTKIYGASDDLIEFEGDVRGEVGTCGDEEADLKPIVFCSDGTVLEVYYGKDDSGVWSVRLVKKGSLFVRVDACVDEDADPHSDVAHFKDGLKWAYYAKEWEKVE